jgi:hypothetical protein
MVQANGIRDGKNIRQVANLVKSSIRSVDKSFQGVPSEGIVPKNGSTFSFADESMESLSSGQHPRRVLDRVHWRGEQD